MKWNVVCPSVCLNRKWSFSSVLLRSQFEGWTKVCPSVLMGHQYFLVKQNVVCLSVVLRFQYEGQNETQFVRLSHVDPILRGELQLSLSVCLTWIPIWGMKRNVVCPSALNSNIRSEWNVVSPSVCLAYIPIWGMKSNVVCSNVWLVFKTDGWKKVCLSVLLWFQHEDETKCSSFVGPSIT